MYGRRNAAAVSRMTIKQLKIRSRLFTVPKMKPHRESPGFSSIACLSAIGGESLHGSGFENETPDAGFTETVIVLPSAMPDAQHD
jgi:hypothetical protein